MGLIQLQEKMNLTTWLSTIRSAFKVPVPSDAYSVGTNIVYEIRDSKLADLNSDFK